MRRDPPGGVDQCAGAQSLHTLLSFDRARMGRDGSSGWHRQRHTLLEVEATNIALEAIKQRYGFAGYNVYGHSGGGLLVGGLLALRSDIGCGVPADGILAP